MRPGLFGTRLPAEAGHGFGGLGLTGGISECPQRVDQLAAFACRHCFDDASDLCAPGVADLLDEQVTLVSEIEQHFTTVGRVVLAGDQLGGEQLVDHPHRRGGVNAQKISQPVQIDHPVTVQDNQGAELGQRHGVLDVGQ